MVSFNLVQEFNTHHNTASEYWTNQTNHFLQKFTLETKLVKIYDMHKIKHKFKRTPLRDTK